MTRIVLVIAALALAGCGTQYGNIATSLNKAAEPIADQTFDGMLDRVCGLPIDIVARAAERHGPEWTNAYWVFCPKLSPLRPTNDAAVTAVLEALVRKLAEPGQ